MFVCVWCWNSGVYDFKIIGYICGVVNEWMVNVIEYFFLVNLGWYV